MSDENENNVDQAEDSVDNDALADEWAAALEESGDAADDAEESDASLEGASSDEPHPAPLQDLGDSIERPVDGDVGLDLILDVPVTISVEIGRSKIPVRNLIQLNQGSVVELDRMAGEPLDVLVNGSLIAHGEVVVVNDKFGVRLTDVVSKSDRLKKMR